MVLSHNKRILIFSLTYYPRPVGGAEVAIKEITDRISPEEISFDLIALRFDSALPKYERMGNVDVYRIGFTTKNPSANDLVRFPLKLNKLFFPVFAFWKANHLHSKNRYDGVWAMMAAFAGFGALFFKLAHPEVPYLLTLQEGDPVKYILKKVRFVRPFFNRIFTKADFVQTISTYLARWAREMGYRGPLEVVPNAVDTKQFSQKYSEKELNALKRKLGKKEGDIYLITTSRLVKKNAVDDVIKALSLLPSHIHFIVLGIGPDEAKLKNLAEEEGVSERVRFLGQIEHKELPKYLKVSDIFIRPSRSEGMGNSFVEAMASELPVIATQEGGIADFLFDPVRNRTQTHTSVSPIKEISKNGSSQKTSKNISRAFAISNGVDAKKNSDREPTGFAVKKNSPEEIVDVVRYILKNPREARQVVENAKKLVFQKYDWNLIAKDMREKVFKKLFV